MFDGVLVTKTRSPCCSEVTLLLCERSWGERFWNFLWIDTVMKLDQVPDTDLIDWLRCRGIIDKNFINDHSDTLKGIDGETLVDMTQDQLVQKFGFDEDHDDYYKVLVLFLKVSFFHH